MGPVIMGEQKPLPLPKFLSNITLHTHSYYLTRCSSVFLSPDASEVWNVFHAEDQFPTGACNSSRYTMAERIYFAADGTPTFQQAGKLGTVQQGPAGEDGGGGHVTNPEPPQN